MKLTETREEYISFQKNYGECLENLNKVFGVVSYSPAVSTYGNYEDIEKTLGEYVDNLVDDGFIGKDTRFAIKCRRVGNHDFDISGNGCILRFW